MGVERGVLGVTTCKQEKVTAIVFRETTASSPIIRFVMHRPGDATARPCRSLSESCSESLSSWRHPLHIVTLTLACARA